jgi:hypothetical protein
MGNMVKSQRFAAFSLPIWAHPKYPKGLTPTRIAHRLLKEIALERWRVANKNGERNLMKYVTANMGIKQTIGNDDLYRKYI